MSNKPEISIVMPVYNRQQYVKGAIESILNQTFTNFEFIIVNDGSTDSTLEILQSYKDDRIVILDNDKNRGIVYSRNRGLKAARGNFVGMFDSDDIALPNKFEIQHKFLIENPEFGMVGAWVKWIDQNGKLLKNKWKLPKSSKYISAIMLFRNYFVQSTILIKKEAIPEEGYSTGFDIVEDSKMWFDVSQKYKVANIQQYLVNYRVHSGNISDMGEKHLANSKKLYKYIFKTMDIEPTEEELDIHYLIKNNKPITNYNQLIEIEKWLLKIFEANLKTKNYDQYILQKVIFNRWTKVCYKAKKIGFKAATKYLNSPLFKYIF
ncbi:MAG: glycosyltransferase family 2 protein [Bacteroidales bacterium]|nr:glycosyltransferase family 2 protein [Bacteroidales bacterium]